MTRREYEERLRDLTAEELRSFNAKLGGNRTTIEQRVVDFARDRKHEGLICYLLDLQTEDEKTTEAALHSARSADQSADSAKWSVIWAGTACVIALAAAIVALVG